MYLSPSFKTHPVLSPPHPTLDYFKANRRQYVFFNLKIPPYVFLKEEDSASGFFETLGLFFKIPKEDDQICGSVLICSFNKPKFLMHTHRVQ